MAKQKQKAAGGLARFKAMALLCALLGIAACAGLLLLQVTQTANDTHNDKIAAQQAQAIAAIVDARYADMRATVALHAASPAIAAALRAEDAEAQIANAAVIKGAIPFATRVDLIPLGKAKVDLGADVPINFAALDLIRRAESQDFVGPEAGANPRDILYTAAPVTDSGGVAGVLFVAYSANYVEDALGGLDNSLGLAQIEQLVDNAGSSVVLEFGSGGKSLVNIRQALQAPNWTLVFNSANSGSVTGLADLALPLAAALVLTLGGIWFAFNKLGAAVRNDSNALVEFGEKLINGHAASSDHFEINHFQKIAIALGSSIAASGGVIAAKAGRRRGLKEVPVPENSSAADITAGSDATSAQTNAENAKDNAEIKAAALASASAAALLTGDAESETDDFLDIGDSDDDFDLSAPENATGSFLQTDLLEVEEQAPADDDFDIDLDEIDEPAATTDASQKTADRPDIEFDAEIFRAYDIRGIVDTNLTPAVVYWIGRAFAAQARSEGQTHTIVGRDGRLSSPEISQQLVNGLIEGGIDVTDIGQVATPMLYFATHKLNTGTGIMITGSHNPPEYNGLKMMIGGTTLAEERITALHQRLANADLGNTDTKGEHSALVIDTDYMDRILDDVAVAQSLKIVVDCGNGVAGGIAPLILQELGCDVIPLYCEVDGTFPNHHPDPADPKNLQDLITVVKAEKADLGIAFDGDGDRIGVVTDTGKIIWPDKLMMLFARDIVGRNPGADIIYDVKCSRHLNNLISEYGGRPIMWKTGHSHIKAKLKETGALLAGEFSGHVAFGERWYGFDDAIYTAARLLEIVGSDTSSVTEVFEAFPSTQSTPEIQITTTESAKFKIIAKLAASGDFGDGTITSIDGVRVDYANGWGLVRASNTSPKLTLRFEADTADALKEVQDRFRSELQKVHTSLTF